MKLVIGHLYPEYLNLYGDNGNVEVLSYRSRKRSIDVEIVPINLGEVSKKILDSVNILFMGGGPDSCQNSIYEDFLNVKKPFIESYVHSNKVGLFICGAYQLLGKYYKDSGGGILDGLGILDLYTEHPGENAKRCIGNVHIEVIEENLALESVSMGASLVGFENHGGRTFLGKGVKPLGRVIKGYGNNMNDRYEGTVFKNCIGTYMHGPFLSKNPHMADYLLSKALGIGELTPLDDTLETTVHTASKMLKQ